MWSPQKGHRHLCRVQTRLRVLLDLHGATPWRQSLSPLFGERRGHPSQLSGRFGHGYWNGRQITWNSQTKVAKVIHLPLPDQRHGCWVSESGQMHMNYGAGHPVNSGILAYGVVGASSTAVFPTLLPPMSRPRRRISGRRQSRASRCAARDTPRSLQLAG